MGVILTTLQVLGAILRELGAKNSLKQLVDACFLGSTHWISLELTTEFTPENWVGPRKGNDRLPNH